VWAFDLEKRRVVTAKAESEENKKEMRVKIPLMLMLFRAYLAQRGAVRSFAAILFSFGEANFKQEKWQ